MSGCPLNTTPCVLNRVGRLILQGNRRRFKLVRLFPKARRLAEKREEMKYQALILAVLVCSAPVYAEQFSGAGVKYRTPGQKNWVRANIKIERGLIEINDRQGNLAARFEKAEVNHEVITRRLSKEAGWIAAIGFGSLAGAWAAAKSDEGTVVLNQQQGGGYMGGGDCRRYRWCCPDEREILFCEADRQHAVN